MSGLGLALGASRTLAAIARIDWLGLVKRYWWLILGALVAVYIAILHGEIRHRDKVIAGQAATLGAVKGEVDRGVGKATQAVDAPTYIRNFVENLATVTAALDRQSAALTAAQRQAAAHVEAAHQAAQPTAVQQQRETVRQKIADPTRTTGLTKEEWGQL